MVKATLECQECKRQYRVEMENMEGFDEVPYCPDCAGHQITIIELNGKKYE